MTKRIAAKGMAALAVSLIIAMPVNAAAIVNKYDEDEVVKVYEDSMENGMYFFGGNEELVANYFINECRVLWGMSDEIKYIPDGEDKDEKYGQIVGGRSYFG